MIRVIYQIKFFFSRDSTDTQKLLSQKVFPMSRKAGFQSSEYSDRIKIVKSKFNFISLLKYQKESWL